MFGRKHGFTALARVCMILMQALSFSASARGLSPVRPAGVSAEIIMGMLETEQKMAQIQSGATPAPTVLTVRDTLLRGEVNYDRIPTTTKENLLRDFKDIRRARMLKDTSNRERRLTWLYPDDGCYARAELAVDRLEKNRSVTPVKIYAFGNLVAPTKNHPSGSVTWWYHVAPIVRVGSEPYVLDPALESEGPLTLKNWLARMQATDEVQLSICDTHSYDPDSACENTPESKRERALKDSAYFLPLEWERVVEMGRNPKSELLKDSSSSSPRLH